MHWQKPYISEGDQVLNLPHDPLKQKQQANIIWKGKMCNSTNLKKSISIIVVPASIMTFKTRSLEKPIPTK